MRRTVIIFLALLNSCRYTPSEPVKAVDYPGNIRTIVEANCLGSNCHSSPTAENDELDLSSWNAMTKGSVFFNEIIPFRPLKSHLFGHINTDSAIAQVIIPTMPLGRYPLSAEDQKTFFSWITQGAKNINGKVPYEDVTKKIFIANQTEAMFSVIDANTERVVRIEPAGDSSSKPSTISMMPDNSSFIVGMIGANGSVKKYDASTYTLIGEFNSNLSPHEIAINPDRSKGYITDISSPTGNVFATFDPQGMRLLKTIPSPLLILPYAAVISPDGTYAYISGYNSDNILRINTHSDSVVTNLPIGADVEIPVTQNYTPQYLPLKIVITPDSKTMYVTCVGTSEVVVYDLQKDSITSRIKLPTSPRAEALSPDGSELWTASWDNSVYVINTVSNQIIATIDSVSQGPHDMIFTPDGNYVYIACEYLLGGHQHHGSTIAVAPSSFALIDRRTRKIVQISELPGFSVGIVCGFTN